MVLLQSRDGSLRQFFAVPLMKLSRHEILLFEKFFNRRERGERREINLLLAKNPKAKPKRLKGTTNPSSPG
jgi:hypothetical protein